MGSFSAYNVPRVSKSVTDLSTAESNRKWVGMGSLSKDFAFEDSRESGSKSRVQSAKRGEQCLQDAIKSRPALPCAGPGAQQGCGAPFSRLNELSESWDFFQMHFYQVASRATKGFHVDMEVSK